MSNKHGPYYDCNKCGDVQTFTADELKEHAGKTWCATCWFHHMEYQTEIEFIDLPSFIPEADQKIQVLTEGLNAIKLHAEMAGLSTVWRIADAALTEATANSGH